MPKNHKLSKQAKIQFCMDFIRDVLLFPDEPNTEDDTADDMYDAIYEFCTNHQRGERCEVALSIRDDYMCTVEYVADKSSAEEKSDG